MTPTSPTSQSAHRARRAEKDEGFSLVELLAVLAILSLMVGAVVLSWPPAPDPVETALSEMEARIDDAVASARLRGDVRALGAAEAGLTLFAFDEDAADGPAWRALATLPWPEDARVERLLVDENGRSERAEALPETATPDAMIEPFGAVDPLPIRIRGPRASYRIDTDARGLTRTRL